MHEDSSVLRMRVLRNQFCLIIMTVTYAHVRFGNDIQQADKCLQLLFLVVCVFGTVLLFHIITCRFKLNIFIHKPIMSEVFIG